MSTDQHPEATEPLEVCRLCSGATTVRPDDDIPLCQGHWNAWLGRYLKLYPGHEIEPAPCAAHLIRAAVAAANGDGR